MGDICKGVANTHSSPPKKTTCHPFTMVQNNRKIKDDFVFFLLAVSELQDQDPDPDTFWKCRILIPSKMKRDSYTSVYQKLKKDCVGIHTSSRKCKQIQRKRRGK
jgi:hypothetical protein